MAPRGEKSSSLTWTRPPGAGIGQPSGKRAEDGEGRTGEGKENTRRHVGFAMTRFLPRGRRVMTWHQQPLPLGHSQGSGETGTALPGGRRATCSWGPGCPLGCRLQTSADWLGGTGHSLPGKGRGAEKARSFTARDRPGTGGGTSLLLSLVDPHHVLSPRRKAEALSTQSQSPRQTITDQTLGVKHGRLFPMHAPGDDGGAPLREGR